MKKSTSTSSFVSRTKSLPNPSTNPSFNVIKPVLHYHSFPDAHSYSSEYKYESLKELLASLPSNYPLITCTYGADQLPNIRNRLMQKAAWSYLKPAMPAIKRPTQKCLFFLLWERLSNEIKRPVKFMSRIYQVFVDLFAAAGVKH